MNKGSPRLPEPWLRETLTEVPAVQRAVLHALELAEEDVIYWCGDLSNEQLHAQPHGLASVAFHLRHIVRSCDRLLTYAEGRELNDAQMTELNSEMDASGMAVSILSEFEAGLASAAERVKKLDPSMIEVRRKVGRKELSTTLGGLLVHIADHTQRHVGQAITTAKVVRERHL